MSWKRCEILILYSRIISNEASSVSLKPMDSFGTLQKLKSIFFLVNAEFYRAVWTINALLTVRSKILPFSGNNQSIKLFGVPPNTLP